MISYQLISKICLLQFQPHILTLPYLPILAYRWPTRISHPNAFGIFSLKPSPIFLLAFPTRCDGVSLYAKNYFCNQYKTTCNPLISYSILLQLLLNRYDGEIFERCRDWKIVSNDSHMMLVSFISSLLSAAVTFDQKLPVEAYTGWGYVTRKNKDAR